MKDKRTDVQNLIEKIMGKGTPNSVAQLQYKTYDFAKKLSDGMVDCHNILDIGCGSGYGAFHLSNKKNVLVEAIDVIPWSCWENTDNLRFFQFDATRIFSNGKKYDLIVSSQNIEHIIDPIKALILTSEMLKDNGISIIATPNKDVSLIHLDHWYEFNAKNLEKFCKIAFEQVEILYQHINKDEYFLIKDTANTPKNIMKHMFNKTKIFLKGGIVSNNKFIKKKISCINNRNITFSDIKNHISNMEKYASNVHEPTKKIIKEQMVPTVLIALCKKPRKNIKYNMFLKYKYKYLPLFEIH